MNYITCRIYGDRIISIDKLMRFFCAFFSKKIVAVCAVTILLQACSSTRFIPEASERFSKVENGATLTVMRKWAFVASGRAIDLELDGRKIASVSNGKAVTFPASPGKHFMAMYWGVVSVDVKSNEHYYFLFNWDGTWNIKQLAQEEGINEFRGYDNYTPQ